MRGAIFTPLPASKNDLRVKKFKEKLPLVVKKNYGQAFDKGLSIVSMKPGSKSRLVIRRDSVNLLMSLKQLYLPQLSLARWDHCPMPIHFQG
jgi:hypothetical protein